MELKELVKYFGRESNICSTEYNGTTCTYGVWNSETSRYDCSDVSGDICCGNKVSSLEPTSDRESS